MRSRNVGSRLARIIIAGLFTLALPASRAAAQTNTGSIRGFVRGTAGAPVAAAQIVARNAQLGTDRGALSNDAGFYSLPGLRPGTYELEVRRIGFTPATRRVVVGVGQVLSLDVQLVQTAQELAAVVVTAPAAAETQSSEVATNVTRTQIENLPTRDRNFLDLALLAPGIRPSVAGNISTSITGGALTPQNVNVFIDGASYKNDIIENGVVGQNSSQGNPFPQNAVQEYRVITQNYKAEYQKAASAIITAVTRTGGTSWDWSAFGYGIVPGFAASDGLGRPYSNYRRLQAGGTVGGPLIPRRLGFFASYEGNFKNQPSTITPGTPPDGVTIPVNLDQYAGTFQQTFRENLGFAKLTWTPDDRNTVDVSGNVRIENDFRGFGNFGSAPFVSRQVAEGINNNVYTGLASWKRVMGNLFNEAQFTAQQYTWNPQPENPDLIGLEYQNIIRLGGKDTRQQFTQRRFSLRDDITWSAAQLGGNHVFKAGASLDYLQYVVKKQQFYNPLFTYTNDNGFAFPVRANYGFGNPDLSTNNTQIGLYVQDDWNVTPRFVLNLGVRWDVETNMFNNGYVTPASLADSLRGALRDTLYSFVNLDDYITNGRSDRPPFWGAIQPRLGFSYDLTGNQRTVLFGGAGIYYDRDIYNYFLDEKFRRQYSVLQFTFNDSGPTTACPQCIQWQDQYLSRAGLESIIASGQGPRPEVFLVKNDTRPPKSYQFSAGVRQALGATYAISLAYTGIRGYNGMAFVKGADWGALGPNYSNLLVSQDAVQSRSNQLQAKLDKTMRPGGWWGGGVAVTVGKAEQKGDYFFSLDPRYQQVKDYRWRRADFDQRYSVVANGVFRLPFEIMASTIISLGSGTAQQQTDCRIQDPTGQCAINYISPPKKNFIVPDAFATRDVSLRLQKNLPLAGGQEVGIFADLFNAFNFDNLGCYNYFIPNSGIGDNRDYGRPGCASEGRRLQIGVTYGRGAR